MDPAPIMDAVQAGLGVTQAELARLIGVDVRTLPRWRTHEAVPRGAGWTVLLTLRDRLEAAPERAEALRKLVREALEGHDALAYLMERLLSGV